jgi:hypothetical protein
MVLQTIIMWRCHWTQKTFRLVQQLPYTPVSIDARLFVGDKVVTAANQG